MTEVQDRAIQTALEMIAHQPEILSAIIGVHAKHSAGGVYYTVAKREDDSTALVFAADLPADKAERLMDFLVELTDGAVPDAQSHKLEIEIAESMQVAGVARA